MSVSDAIRPAGRLLWGAGVAASVGLLALAPALVQAQAVTGKPATDEVVVAQATAEPSWEEKPYTITDGKVDFGTYNGYRRYEAYSLFCT